VHFREGDLMPIVGFNLKTINAKFDEKKINENMEIGSTPKIENVVAKELNFAGMDEVAVISFSFKTQYMPDVAEIEFTGEILYKTDDVKKIVKIWKDENRLDDQVGVEVFNAIFRRCLTKAIGIADDLRLPPPLTFPIVTKKLQEKANAQQAEKKGSGKK
jgi:hypothetical protein